jgi:Mor family transcriptional regulator
VAVFFYVRRVIILYGLFICKYRHKNVLSENKAFRLNNLTFDRSVVQLKYKNAKVILPEQLLKEIQKYVQGEIIYVPGDDSFRAGWGESNGTRERYKARNNEIIRLYKSGVSMEAITNKYYLSEYSVKKIIYDNRKCESKQNA